MEKEFIRRHWGLLLMLFCLVAGGGLDEWLLTAKADTLQSLSNLVIDDFNRLEGHKNGLIWTTIADQTKNYRRVGTKQFVQSNGRSCLNIKELVPTKKNVIIVGTKAAPDNRGNLNFAGNDGIYLRAKGTGGQWTLGLWIESKKAGTSLYQAPFELKNRWQEFRLPFRMFRSMPKSKTLNSRELFRIVTMPALQQRTVEIFLDEIGFYKEQKMYKKLTPEQERIIIHKGTERPFSGKYNNHFEEGIYTCMRCGAELFASSSKFKSGCGWPSFDEQIEGAVKWQRDADGVRTEILCNQCGGHLGHVFLGEKLTPKDTRYCVNSLSMDFILAEKQQQTARAIFASGCFWGTEYYFQRAPGVISTTVGYTGGHIDNPTYKQVCTDKTGHAEAVEVVYDPAIISYEQLAKLFFETHDFTQLNRQGPDIGTQYRSAIFYLDDEQKRLATQLIQTLNQKGYNVKTQIAPADKFWPAEEYHQDYYDKTKKLPYCHIYKQIF
ncbi:MAG: bifunctional methionine sulfoxide reductase B/A protein [Phycisphaerae bacterium]